MRPRRLSQRRHTTRSPFEVGRVRRIPTVTYQALEGGWWLWWPCERCGGTPLPLSAQPADAGVTRDRGCPGCETHRRRLEPAGEDPEVWYDTWLEDWVVRLPCSGLREGVLMPMELRWFDSSWAGVIRRAADLAFGSA
jgi:hypothetical protein